MQLSGWGRLKAVNGWTWQHLSVGRPDASGERVSGSALLLFRAVPGIGVKLAYCPRGVVVDWSDKASVDLLLSELARRALRAGALLLRLDPAVADSDPNVANALRAHGFTRTDPGEDHRMLSQPAVRMIADLSDLEAYHAGLPKGTTWSIRKGAKSGLSVDIAGAQNLPEFHQLMQVTGQRDGFQIRSLGYFESMWRALGEGDQASMDVTVVRLDPAAALADAEAVLADATRQLGNKRKARTHTEKVLRQIEELSRSVEHATGRVEELRAAVQASPQPRALAASVLVRSGRKASYLYAASSNEFRELRPSYSMVWALMRHVRERGCTDFDFGGIDASEGLEIFKSQWNPARVSYVGEFDKPLVPVLGTLFQGLLAMSKRRKLGPVHTVGAGDEA